MLEQNEVTRILKSIRDGDQNSSNELLPLVYAELRKLAESKFRHERPGQTLQPTALVHEAFLRLIHSNDQQDWESRSHFFAAAANAMRRILIENARRRGSQKRGGDLVRVEVAIDSMPIDFDDSHLIRLDEALEKLAKENPSQAQLIELRFFGGLTIEQSCEILKISRATASRYWNHARAWLFLQLTD